MHPVVALGWGIAELGQLRFEGALWRLGFFGPGQRGGLLRPILATALLWQGHGGELFLVGLASPCSLQIFSRRRGDVAQQIIRFHVAGKGIVLFERSHCGCLAGFLTGPGASRP